MIYNDITIKHSFKKPVMLLIGYFDAMHRGHVRIISDLVLHAREADMLPMILTFDTLSVKPLSDAHILTVRDRLHRMNKLGIRNVIMCNFDRDIRQMTAEKFISTIKDNFNVKAMLVGQDFRFGRDRLGDVGMLSAAGIDILRTEPVMNDDGCGKISTNRIKALIMSGDIENANKMLGRSFSIPGKVHKGKQLGRTLGFPTMNIHNPDILRPADGAYITQTHVKGSIYPSMTFVSEQVIETHLLGYKNFSYNLQINIDFFKKIRDNRTFKNLDGLKEQLGNDLALIRRYFENEK